MASLKGILEPGETVLYRPGGTVFDWIRILLVLIIALTGAGVIGLMVKAYLAEGGGGVATSAIELMGMRISADHLVATGAGVATFLSICFVWMSLLEPKPGSFVLTDRRVLRFGRGFWSGWIETLALADIAEIRRSRTGVMLVATSCDAVRRLRRDGNTEPAGADREFEIIARPKTAERLLAALGRAAEAS